MRTIGLALTLALTPGLALAQGSATAGQSIHPEIRKVADAYVKATLAGDARAVAALYTEDAVEMPPNQPAARGRAAIEAYYQKQFSDPSVKFSDFTLNHLETTAAGEVGYDVGTYKQAMTMQGKPATDSGKYAVILKKVGGEWKVAYAIYNSDQPPMGGPSPQQ